MLRLQEEFLKDVMEFLLLRGHSRLIPQGGLEEFPDAILNGKRLDLYNLYKEVWLLLNFWIEYWFLFFGNLTSKTHIESVALLHRWSPEEAFMSAMVSTGRGRSSLRCTITQWPIEWLYVQQAFPHRFVTLMILFLLCLSYRNLSVDETCFNFTNFIYWKKLILYVLTGCWKYTEKTLWDLPSRIWIGSRWCRWRMLSFVPQVCKFVLLVLFTRSCIKITFLLLDLQLFNSSAAGDWVNCGICGEWAHFGCDRRQGLGAFKV